MPQSIVLRIGPRYGSAVEPLSTFHPDFHLFISKLSAGPTRQAVLISGDIHNFQSPGVCIATDRGVGAFIEYFYDAAGHPQGENHSRGCCECPAK
jgi:hypothetical protein